MHLRQETTREDAEIAIKTMMKSFVETQKHGTAKKLEKEYKFYLGFNWTIVILLSISNITLLSSEQFRYI